MTQGNVLRFSKRDHRTPEEIRAQLEARYAEMEAEAARRDADPMLLHPCKTCRFMAMRWPSSRAGWYCTNPLVTGFATGENEQIAVWDSAPPGDWHASYRPKAAICGPEKALWAPKPTRWQRFINMLERWMA
jgi:hypothetical protein